MNLDSGFKARLKSAMEVRDPPTSQSRLARHLGISAQAVNQWVKKGKTTLPKLDNLAKAADFLQVSLAWLAYGQGQMRKPSQRTLMSGASSQNTEDSLLTKQWELALLDALASGGNECWQHSIRHPSGQSNLTADWLSDSIVANLALYSNTANLVSGARQRLWQLAILREAMSPLPDRRPILILSPLHAGGEVPVQHIQVLRTEARLLGLDVLHAGSPIQTAAILLGKEERQVIPIADDLGLNPGLLYE